MTRSVKRALTASDVRAAAAAGQRELTVPTGVVVTALAHDVARERGVALTPAPSTGPPGATRGGPRVSTADDPVGVIGASGGAAEGLEASVRSIVARLLSSERADVRASNGIGGVKHVDARQVRLTPFAHPGPEQGQDVRSVDVVTAADGAPMAAGFLTLTRGCFPWTLTYDEVQFVIEGELHIGTDRGTVIGRTGDVIYVPKGTSITFGTPSWAKFLYVTFPADWEGGGA